MASDYGFVDLNMASQAVCLAVNFAISEGQEESVEVRGVMPESNRQLRVMALPSGSNTSAMSGCFRVGCGDDDPQTVTFERGHRWRVYFVDQRSIKHHIGTSS